MSNQKRSDNSQQEILDVQQRRSLLIAGFLQQLALPSMFNRELTEQDFAIWEKFLANYPIPAIEYAFENWTRNGKQFPKPANIHELIGAWKFLNPDDSEFKPCNTGACIDGWIRGTTGRGNTVVSRCQCFISWSERQKQKAVA